MGAASVGVVDVLRNTVSKMASSERFVLVCTEES